MTTTKDKNNIIFDAGKVTTIHFDEPREFEGAISFDAYVKAFEMTKEIVISQGGLKDTDYRNPGKGTSRRNQEQVYNIISFTGARGSGKTSVMLSYMEFLKDYCRNISKYPESDWKPKAMYDREFKVMFTGLEYIDASLMNKKEEILGSVLSKMLSKWQLEEDHSAEGRGIAREEDYNYRKRQLNKEFGNVYEYLKTLKNPDKVLSEDSEIVIDELQKLSMSRNLKKSFQDLVSSYLEIMRYPGKDYHYDKHFLVICIDDLDMNIQNGYRLLEEIRKYLMIPNVLVLLTVNMSQLEKICMEHYSKKFRSIKHKKDDYILTLSTEYLDKIMPGHRQILLPSEDEWPFFKNKKLRIVNRRCSFFEEALSTTDFSRKYFDQFLNMKFSVDSACLNYLTPGTIREFGEWIETVSGVDKVEEVKERNRKCRQWFWKECFQKLCKKKLNRENAIFLQDMSDEKVEKQLIWLGEKIQPKNSPALYYLENRRPNKKIKYMGELLELMSTQESERFENKIYSNMMKIFLTAAVAEQMEVSENGNTEKSFLLYYGHSIWGNWENKMLTPLREMKKDNMGQIMIGKFEYGGDQAEFGIELAVKKNFDMKKWADVVEIFRNEDNYKKMINFQYVLLFHSELKNSRGKIWEIKYDKNNHVCLKMNAESTGMFSISGFVMNCYEGVTIVKTFLNEVIKDFKDNSDYAECGSNITDRQLKEYLSILEKGGGQNKDFFGDLWKMKRSLNNVRKDPLLPLDNIEFIFDIGEKIQYRLGREMDVVKDDEVKEDKIKELIIRRIQQFFEILEDSLKELDKVYPDRKYADNFKKNMLVNLIKNRKNGIEMMELLAQNLMKIGRKPLDRMVGNDPEWEGDN